MGEKPGELRRAEASAGAKAVPKRCLREFQKKCKATFINIKKIENRFIYETGSFKTKIIRYKTVCRVHSLRTGRDTSLMEEAWYPRNMNSRKIKQREASAKLEKKVPGGWKWPPKGGRMDER